MNNTSENIDLIATALAKAQGEISNPVFNKINPHFKSAYADLSSVLNAVRPALSKNGIAIMQFTNLEESGLVLYSRLIHTSGQWMQSIYPVSSSSKHQDLAAAMTYAKRVTLSAQAGVAGEEDDDGNAANTVPAKAATVTPMAKKDEVKATLVGEDAEKAMTEMSEALTVCMSKVDLQGWATKYSAVKNRLSAADQMTVTKAFQATQERLRES
jgi:hypothetical protein